MSKHKIGQISYMFFPLFFLCMLLLFTGALSTLKEDRSEEEKTRIYNTLAQAAAACYAVEGSYPSDLQYLIDHYGVQIDTSAYTVIYESIASNLMPDITVLDNQP